MIDKDFDIRMQFNDGGLEKFLEEVRPSKLKSAFRSAIRKSLNIIKKKTLQNMREISFKEGKKLDTGTPVIFKNNYGTKYLYPPFRQSVFVRVAKSGKVGNVAIRKPSEPRKSNPILTMIHNAKGERKTKGRFGRKAHSTGSIGPHKFFQSAVNSTKTEVQNSLEKNVMDAINKVKEKHNRK